MSVESVDEAKDRFWLNIIYILSAVLCGAVAFLILGPRPETLQGKLDVSGLPRVNASINSLTTVLLVVGLVLVKKRRLEAHKKVMLSAFACSAAFLVTYVIYHWFKPAPTKYQGDHELLYFFILISHILLAAAILPMALITLYRGWRGQLDKHTKIARITFPIWLYVSITGVVIYLMLY